METATMLKKPKIEKGEEAESNKFTTQIPDDREALLEYMDERAKSIQRFKDQISLFERKLAEERKLLADAEAKFLSIDRVEKDDTLSKPKTKLPGKTGSLLGISEFWTEGNKAKTANENSTPQPRCEMESLKPPAIILQLAEERKLLADAEAKFLSIDRVEKDDTLSKPKTKLPGKTGSLLGISEFWTEGNKAKTANENSTPQPRCEMESLKPPPPAIILPPSFKRKASAPVRTEVNETPRAQPMSTRDYNIPKEDKSGSEAKRARSIPNDVVRERETSAQENQNQSQARDNRAQDNPTQAQARDNRTQAQHRDNQTQTKAQDRDNQTQARDNHTSNGFSKPRARVSSSISGKKQPEKSEFRGHNELIALIGRSSLRATIEARTVSMLPSCHTKRVRSLALSPSNRELFATSALDGMVNFWKLQSDSSTTTLFKTVNHVDLNQKKWAEDIAWHPHKSALFSVYTADENHPQISAIYLNEARQSCESKFLKDKPHSKGLINRIMFTPWDDPCFITGGCDHAVVLWREKYENDEWKSRLLHKDLHSSSVMGVAGMRHNNLVLSCGDDRRFVGFDAREEKLTFKHRLDNKCTSLLPNPRDVNLVMVNTRQLDRQLRLYDVRIPQTELFSFGWKQQSSESQSALINQSWSPDGLHISSGSADPVIHIFDIRYNAPSPSLSIKTHKKRVFKAEWHSSLQLLVSISSDLEIGIHELW